MGPPTCGRSDGRHQGHQDAGHSRQVEINDMVWKAEDRQRGFDAFFATGPATAVFKGN
jgi:hypothetical protein